MPTVKRGNNNLHFHRRLPTARLTADLDSASANVPIDQEVHGAASFASADEPGAQSGDAGLLVFSIHDQFVRMLLINTQSGSFSQPNIMD
jgi:hypothetical protein